MSQRRRLRVGQVRAVRAVRYKEESDGPPNEGLYLLLDNDRDSWRFLVLYPDSLDLQEHAGEVKALTKGWLLQYTEELA